MLERADVSVVEDPPLRRALPVRGGARRSAPSARELLSPAAPSTDPQCV